MEYEFLTFPARELAVSEDTYRPEKDGFEIGFELSASDGIRLKWAYRMGLLDISRDATTNHPVLLVLDEPRQQEAAEVSFAGFLAEAARLSQAGAQIVIATSERLATIEEHLRERPCQLLVYKTRIIQRVEEGD